MPKHVTRLILLLAAVGILALTAKLYFVPRSFWRFGHYRAVAVTEIANDPPIYQGSRYCQRCHQQEFHDWSSGAHRVDAAHDAHVLKAGETYGVNCEDCHGPAGRHPIVGKPSPPAVEHTHQVLAYARYDRVTGKMQVPTDTVVLCTQCHGKLLGRPAAQLQIVVSQHAGAQQCIACHNPHAPKVVFPPIPKEAQIGSTTSGKATSARCAACHGAEGKSVNALWPNLAGQQRAYLVAALEAYRTGTRKAPMMNQIASTLSDTDIGNLAAYFSSLPWKTLVSRQFAAAAGVREIREKACMTCHGADGISRRRTVPNLAGQNEAYLAGALEAYQSNVRQDALMSRVAHSLTAANIKQLSTYYAHSACADTACGAAP
ncbi:MAG: c-type cytochrome [Alphaproteobacteria bacterium]|nr:c-type cytochrome [Alphaproteobacteria bacterium]